MSWQTYVDDNLMCEIGRGDRLTAAAVIGQDGSVWYQTDRFPVIKPEELTAILNGFAEPGSLAPTGLYIGGTKYKVIQGEPGAVIRGEKIFCSTAAETCHFPQPARVSAAILSKAMLQVSNGETSHMGRMQVTCTWSVSSQISQIAHKQSWSTTVKGRAK